MGEVGKTRGTLIGNEGGRPGQKEREGEEGKIALGMI